MNEKAKKEMKNIEKLLKELFSLEKKEKQKVECLTKLLDILENNIDKNINYELLYSSIEDLYSSSNINSNKLWLNTIIYIIKVKPEFRQKCFLKAIDLIINMHCKETEDLTLKVRAINSITNCCLEVDEKYKNKLLEFLFFTCVLSFKYVKDNVIIMILNIIKSWCFETDGKKLQNKLLKQFIVETMISEFLISYMQYKNYNNFGMNQSKMMSFSNSQSQVNNTFLASNISNNSYFINPKIEEEKQIMTSCLSIFIFYVESVIYIKQEILNIILGILCIYVDIDREYSWKCFKSIVKKYSNKAFLELFIIAKKSDDNKNVYVNLQNNMGNLKSNCLSFLLKTHKDILFYSILNEYEENIVSNNLKFFESKFFEEVQAIVTKSRVKMIIGSIFFIGMSVWGYEKLDNIDISSSVILSHFSKLSLEYNKSINKDIIYCLKRVIKKYGDILTDEWNEIFSILKIVGSDSIKTGSIGIYSNSNSTSNYNSQSTSSNNLFNSSNLNTNNNTTKNVKNNNFLNSKDNNYQDTFINSNQNSNIQNNIQEMTYKNLIEITDIIKSLVLLGKFHGKLEEVNILIGILKTPKTNNNINTNQNSIDNNSRTLTMTFTNSSQSTDQGNKNIKDSEAFYFNTIISKRIYKICLNDDFIYNLESYIIDYILK